MEKAAEILSNRLWLRWQLLREDRNAMVACWKGVWRKACLWLSVDPHPRCCVNYFGCRPETLKEFRELWRSILYNSNYFHGLQWTQCCFFLLLLLLQYFHATDKTLLRVHEVWASLIFIHVCLKGSVIICHADCFVVMNVNEEALYFFSA